jgi:hypothetical protein
MYNGDTTQTSSVLAKACQKTVDEVLQEQIEQARKAVENLCIKRAKLEALNMHKMPYNEVRNLLDTYPF